jgi:very-short-patch-repair endonuclease
MTPRWFDRAMRYTDIDHQIEALAARQHGAFSRQQAFTIGASERFVQRRLAQRHWRRVVPGVFVLAWSAGSWLRHCKVAELSVDGSGVAGFAAAALHGLPGFRRGAIELVAPVNAHCRHPTAVVHRYAGAQLTTVDGIQVTTVAQTIFDLAGRLRPWRTERVLDDALTSHRLSLVDLEQRLEFYLGTRRPGLPVMRALIGERGADGWTPPESELEAMLLRLLARVPGHPRIVRQAPLPWWSSRPGRVDVLLPDERVIIEADGRRWHTRVADFDHDRWRDNQAIAHGHRVMRFTWVHLHDLPDDALALVCQTLASNPAA